MFGGEGSWSPVYAKTNCITAVTKVQGQNYCVVLAFSGKIFCIVYVQLKEATVVLPT